MKTRSATPFKIHHVTPDAHDISVGQRFQERVLADTPLQGNRRLLAEMKTRLPKRLSMEPVQNRLQGLLDRAKFVCNPTNYAAAKAFLEGALGAIHTDEHKKDMRDMVVAAQAGDLEQQAALRLLVATNVGHLVRVAGTWVQWYKTESLAADEAPLLRRYVPQQVNVRIANSDGTLATRHAMPNVEDSSLVDLFFVLTDSFVGTLFDVNKGFIGDAQLGTVDLAMDLMEKIDGLLQTPFTVGSANSVFTSAFTADGSTASHYHLSSRIFASNLPAGNIIAPSSNGAATKPRFDTIRAIDQYFSQWGTGFFGEGDFSAATIHVASGIASQFGDEFTATTVANLYTDGLYGNRAVVGFNGRNYTIVPDNTIDPADKHVYVRSTMPAGIYFDKPAGALVHREDHVRENEFEVFERSAMGLAFPTTWAPRVLAVKFKT